MTQQDTLTLTFSKLITLGTGEGAPAYEKVELREPTAGELEKATRADTAAGVIINLVSLVGSIPRVAAEKMTQRDMAKASAFFGTFTDAGQPEAAAGLS